MTPDRWFDELKPGDTVVVRNQLKPRFSSTYEAKVEAVQDGTVSIQAPWIPVPKLIEFRVSTEPVDKSEGRLSLEPGTPEALVAVEDEHFRRAVLQRIHRIVEPNVRAAVDSGDTGTGDNKFRTPLHIGDSELDALVKIVQEYEFDPQPLDTRPKRLRCLHRYIKHDLQAEQDVTVPALLLSADLQAIWDILLKVEQNYIDQEGFVFKEFDGDDRA